MVCDRKHKHAHLESTYKDVNLTTYAESYTSAFAEFMVKHFEKNVTEADAWPVEADDVDMPGDHEEPDGDAGEKTLNRHNRRLKLPA